MAAFIGQQSANIDGKVLLVWHRRCQGQDQLVIVGSPTGEKAKYLIGVILDPVLAVVFKF